MDYKRFLLNGTSLLRVDYVCIACDSNGHAIWVNFLTNSDDSDEMSDDYRMISESNHLFSTPVPVTFLSQPMLAGQALFTIKAVRLTIG